MHDREAGAEAERLAHFTRRLEAFSDIVFGLSLSQLAFQLGVPDRVAQLVNQPERYVMFFLSFALICAFWFAHYRLFRHFTPTAADVVLNFVYLAFAALVPFAMQVMIRFGSTTIGFAIYAICVLGTSLPMIAMQWRVLWRRDLNNHDANGVYRRLLINGAMSLAMAIALLLLPFGSRAASYGLLILPGMLLLLRTRLGRLPAAFQSLEPRPEEALAR